MKILSLQSALAVSLLFASVIAVSAATPDGVATLKIGDAAPDFDLPGVDGKNRSLKDFAKADVLMVAFISNHCPDSQGTEKRLITFVEEMKGSSFALVAINPNDPAALRPDELGYSKYNDSFDEMKLHAKEQGFNFPYLNDGQTQMTAKAYGCLATPHVFVFNKDRKLQYKGRFDDSRFADPATVTANDGPNAVKALLAGEPVKVQETKVHGCSTKWASKKDAVTADQEKWEKGEVEVELIDAKGVAALRKNDTQKVRLFQCLGHVVHIVRRGIP
jgi:peroxiredoxin